MIASVKLPAISPPACARAVIPVWYIVISGFTQSLRSNTGSEALWKLIRAARPDAEALLFPWNADWEGVADLVWRSRPHDRPVRVYCSAYSWGVGWGFLRLAAELSDRGIEIEHAVLCDGVYRSKYLALEWLALTRGRKIVVPPNVREVDWFHQTTGLPMGHQVVAADPERTTVHPGVLCPGVTHHYMDDQRCWWQKSLDVANSARPAAEYESVRE